MLTLANQHRWSSVDDGLERHFDLLLRRRLARKHDRVFTLEEMTRSSVRNSRMTAAVKGSFEQQCHVINSLGQGGYR